MYSFLNLKQKKRKDECKLLSYSVFCDKLIKGFIKGRIGCYINELNKKEGKKEIDRKDLNFAYLLQNLSLGSILYSQGTIEDVVLVNALKKIYGDANVADIELINKTLSSESSGPNMAPHMPIFYCLKYGILPMNYLDSSEKIEVIGVKSIGEPIVEETKEGRKKIRAYDAVRNIFEIAKLDGTNLSRSMEKIAICLEDENNISLKIWPQYHFFEALETFCNLDKRRRMKSFFEKPMIRMPRFLLSYDYGGNESEF